MIPRLLLAASALTFAACSPATETPAAAEPEPPTTEAVSAPAAKKGASPSRETLTSAPMIDPDEMQEAASVSQLHLMPELSAKVFSLSGGDPAVNGLVTYLALFVSPAEGWRTYPIGDFAAWRVTESGPGMVRIDYRQDTAGPAGDIVQRRARAVIEWFPEPDGGPPPEVAIATQPAG